MDTRTLELAGVKPLVENKKFDDHKHPAATKEDLADTAPSQVFEWVKTGKWKLSDFNAWIKARA